MSLKNQLSYLPDSTRNGAQALADYTQDIKLCIQNMTQTKKDAKKREDILVKADAILRLLSNQNTSSVYGEDSVQIETLLEMVDERIRNSAVKEYASLMIIKENMIPRIIVDGKYFVEAMEKLISSLLEATTHNDFIIFRLNYTNAHGLKAYISISHKKLAKHEFCISHQYCQDVLRLHGIHMTLVIQEGTPEIRLQFPQYRILKD